MRTVFSLLKKASKTVTKHWLLLLVAIIIDLVFIVSYGMIYTNLFADTADHVDAFNRILAEQTGAFVGTQNPEALTLMPEALDHYHAILWGIAYIIGTFYVIFAISQGMNWWIAHREEGERSGFLLILWRSLRLNLLWALLSAGIIFLMAWLGQQSAVAPVPIIGPKAYQYTAFALLSIVGYFAMVSFAFITHPAPLRTSFVQAVKNIKRFIVVIIMGFAVMVLCGVAMVTVAAYGYLFSLIAVIVMLGWIALCRVWLSLLAHDPVPRRA
jgi:hypothetical protein